MEKKGSICIIDDDRIFVFGTRKIMKKIGFKGDLIVYNNGQDAVEGLTEMSQENKKLPSLILLDLNMPIMNGWEFLEEYKKIPLGQKNGVTLYIMSSSVDPIDCERAKSYTEVKNYILKPVTPQDLDKIIR
ncbi:response regulator [Sediminicola sp. 1XM1-17]|uniref:response regulator n=1 Tax=Sediminicola sp. 1XM1-17 TaxID=3127702 RepID=UPI003077FC0B